MTRLQINWGAQEYLLSKEKITKCLFIYLQSKRKSYVEEGEKSQNNRKRGTVRLKLI